MNNLNTPNTYTHTSNILTSSIKNEEAYQALENMYQISNYLKCGIDKNTLAIMINMVESGCKP